MATNVERYCAYCDNPVKTPTEPLRTIGREEGGPEQRFVHANGPGCGRQFLLESQTYTMGDADDSDR